MGSNVVTPQFKKNAECLEFFNIRSAHPSAILTLIDCKYSARFNYSNNHSSNFICSTSYTILYTPLIYSVCKFVFKTNFARLSIRSPPNVVPNKPEPTSLEWTKIHQLKWKWRVTNKKIWQAKQLIYNWNAISESIKASAIRTLLYHFSI